MYNCAFKLVAGAPKALKRGVDRCSRRCYTSHTMPTRAEKIAQLENRLVDLQEANRKRESQLLAKKRLLEGLERTRDRKRRTRRLILIGSVVEKDLADPNSDLRQRLDQALEKPKDRALFRSPPTLCPGPGSPLCSPLRMDPGQDHRRRLGALFQGDTHTLPDNLKGRTITVQAKSGKSWDATITEVVERLPNLILVRAQKPDS